MYIKHWEYPERPEGTIKLWWQWDTANAARWVTRQAAESFIQEIWARMARRLNDDAAALRNSGDDFTIEQRAPNEFVISFPNDCHSCR
jgi:hypothetical protein